MTNPLNTDSPKDSKRQHVCHALELSAITIKEDNRMWVLKLIDSDEFTSEIVIHYCPWCGLFLDVE